MISTVTTEESSADEGIQTDLANRIEAQLLEKFDYLLDGLDKNVADALFEEMLDLDEQDALKQHFNVMRAMRVKWHVCRVAFGQHFQRAWQTLVDGQEPLGVVLPPEATTACETWCRSVEGKFKPLISDVDERLARFLGQDSVSSPLGTRRLFSFFWQAVQVLPLTTEEKLLLVPMFYRFVLDRYGQILVIPHQLLEAYTDSDEEVV